MLVFIALIKYRLLYFFEKLNSANKLDIVNQYFARFENGCINSKLKFNKYRNIKNTFHILEIEETEPLKVYGLLNSFFEYFRNKKRTFILESNILPNQEALNPQDLKCLGCNILKIESLYKYQINHTYKSYSSLEHYYQITLADQNDIKLIQEIYSSNIAKHLQDSIYLSTKYLNNKLDNFYILREISNNAPIAIIVTESFNTESANIRIIFYKNTNPCLESSIKAINDYFILFEKLKTYNILINQENEKASRSGLHGSLEYHGNITTFIKENQNKPRINILHKLTEKIRLRMPNWQIKSDIKTFFKSNFLK